MSKIKSAIITGSYGAIGKAISSGIAAKGYKTTLVGRNESALRSTRDELIDLTGNNLIDFAVVDLSSKDNIKEFAESWNDKLSILINNAATTPVKKEITSKGIEMQFATNVLGYFWMIKFLHKYMTGVDDARIVNVASYWAGGLDLDDPEAKNSSYDNDDVYRRTKQANRMLTIAFADQLRKEKISVLSCHPGDVMSKLSNNLGYGGHESPGKGADTPVWCATAPELKGITGKYFEHKTEVRCKFADNRKNIMRLYEICDSY